MKTLYTTLAFLAIGPLQAQTRTIAVTIDDLPTVSAIDTTIASRQALTDSLLAALTRHTVPAIGFVNERKLGPRAVPAPSEVALLRRWVTAGMELGNHTWSHKGMHNVPLDEYLADVAMGDSVTISLTGPRPIRYFRHPFLHAGRDRVARDSLLRFLSTRGYAIAPVTIDNSDYIFAAAYARRMTAGDRVTADSIASEYLSYMERVVAYYEQQSTALLGRELPQILLLHANALNARTFDALAAMMKRRGYRFVSLGEALRDEAYLRPDGYFGPAGISWIHRWAIAEGRKGGFFAGEPEVPAWIERASQP